jgi:protein-S-isoprenylcysteine O-methyltransferase Ste14
MRLGLRMTLRFSLGLIIFATLVIAPAGTMRFWQGWLLVALIVIPFLASIAYFYKTDPKVIERRMQRTEKVGLQKHLMRWGQPFFFLALMLPGFDFRFGWTRELTGPVPLWFQLAAQGFVCGGLLVMILVLKVNSFASRTIRVETGQPVISSGPYALIRHPMYAGNLLMGLATPIALGSYVTLPIFALLIPFYVTRLLNEEKVLRQELPGYLEFCLHTRSRLIPHVW